MKILIVTAALLGLLYCVNATPIFTEKDEWLFKTWMSQHNKRYEVEEYFQRLQIFTDNMQIIEKHNAGNHKFRMGLNQFSDMTFTEFKKFYLLTEPQNCSATKGNHVSSAGPFPDSIDWRKKGHYVSDVKNQVPYCPGDISFTQFLGAAFNVSSNFKEHNAHNAARQFS